MPASDEFGSWIKDVESGKVDDRDGIRIERKANLLAGLVVHVQVLFTRVLIGTRVAFFVPSLSTDHVEPVLAARLVDSARSAARSLRRLGYQRSSLALGPTLMQLGTLYGGLLAVDEFELQQASVF